jgi:hypothetical protein
MRTGIRRNICVSSGMIIGSLFAVQAFTVTGSAAVLQREHDRNV